MMEMVRLDDDQLFVFRRFVQRHDKCHCALDSLLPFYEYNDHANRSELVKIVADERIPLLEEFIELNKNVRIVDRHGNSPLHLAVIFEKTKVFDYLLSHGVNVNSVNRYTQSPLHLAVINNNEEMIKALISSGADVNMSDESCCTPFHAAATQSTSKLCEILLEHGAKLNFQNLLGKSALYHACQYGTAETVCWLLYQGADATLPDMYDVLPITAAMQQCVNDGHILPSQQQLHEILYKYTFEGKVVHISLPALTVAMRINSPLYPEILKQVDRVGRVKFTPTDLVELCRCAAFLKKDDFMALMTQHLYVVAAMLTSPSELHHSFNLGGNVDDSVVKLMELLDMIFEYRGGLNFLRWSTNYGYFIRLLVNQYKKGRLSYKVLSEMVYFLYSYGLPCEFKHLAVIHNTFGFCDLFHFMLKFDVIMEYQNPLYIMPYLIYDIHCDIDKFLQSANASSKYYKAALKFFSSQKLRHRFESRPAIWRKLGNLPQVPSLLQLSRDVARKYIIKEFKIEKTEDFYKFVNSMPIYDDYKKILWYERELYQI